MQLIFDAGEGTCAVTSKELAAGEAYGELPAATRTGYRFDAVIIGLNQKTF